MVVYFANELGYLEDRNNLESSGKYTAFVLLFLPVILYYPLLEYFFGGTTIGKGILKIKVVNMDGKPATLSQVLLRWLLRMIDVKIGFIVFIISAFIDTVSTSEAMMGGTAALLVVPLPIAGLISILVTDNNQRIGDFAANTVVVHSQKRVTLEQTLLQSKTENYVPVFKQVLKLRDKDIYIIKTVVEQAAKSNHTQVIPLAEKAKKILNVQTNMLPLDFLKTLLKDYNHLAQEKDLG